MINDTKLTTVITDSFNTTIRELDITSLAVVYEFVSLIGKLNIHTISTVDALNSIKDHLFDNGQEQMIDFLLSLHVNLEINNVTLSTIHDLHQNSMDIITTSVFTEEFKRSLRKSSKDDIEPIMLLVLVIRWNHSTFLNTLKNKLKD